MPITAKRCALHRLSEAAIALERALQYQPNDAILHNDFGVLILKQGRPKEAAEHFRTAVRLRPYFPEAFCNLGNSLIELAQMDEAVNCYSKALQLQPNDPSFLFNQSVALTQSGKFDDAMEKMRLALRIRPKYPDVLNNYGNALKEQGRIDEAIAYYRRGVSVAPESPTIISNLLYALQSCPNLDPDAVWGEHCQYGVQAFKAAQANPLPVRASKTISRLRIGYVSPDFRSHVMGMFTALVLPAHDRTRFEVICYSDVAKPDPVTQRIRERVDRWTDLAGLTTEAAVQKIRADEIDILIDLAGHTAGNRLPVFAQRGASSGDAIWLSGDHWAKNRRLFYHRCVPRSARDDRVLSQ